jgi:hypothetical protein
VIGDVIPLGEALAFEVLDFDRVVIPGTVTFYSVRLGVSFERHGFAGAVEVNVEDRVLRAFVQGLHAIEQGGEPAVLSAMSPRRLEVTVDARLHVRAMLGREWAGDVEPRHEVRVGFDIDRAALDAARRGLEALLTELLEG